MGPWVLSYSSKYLTMTHEVFIVFRKKYLSNLLVRQGLAPYKSWEVFTICHLSCTQDRDLKTQKYSGFKILGIIDDGTIMFQFKSGIRSYLWWDMVRIDSWFDIIIWNIWLLGYLILFITHSKLMGACIGLFIFL